MARIRADGRERRDKVLPLSSVGKGKMSRDRRRRMDTPVLRIRLRSDRAKALGLKSQVQEIHVSPLISRQDRLTLIAIGATTVFNAMEEAMESAVQEQLDEIRRLLDRTLVEHLAEVRGWSKKKVRASGKRT